MQKWVELNKAKSELDVDFDYLYDMVINGSIKSTLLNDEILVDISPLKKNRNKTNQRSIRTFDSLKQELEAVREDYIWLKSENMRNDRTIQEYYQKFKELKSMNDHLMDIIAQQAAEIRTLKGYSKASRRSEAVYYDNIPKTPRKQKGLGISFWMMMPVFGLILTALVEFVKTYHIINFTEILKAFPG